MVNTMREHRLSTDIRIIRAIATKDVWEAVRNKNALAIVVTALLVVLFYRALPLLNADVAEMRVRIYDAGDSALAAMLENSVTVDATTGYSSIEAMKERVADDDVPELGLVIPADFDRLLEAGTPPALTAYTQYWVSDRDVSKARERMEGELAALLGIAIDVEVSGDRIDALPTSHGLGSTVALSLAYATAVIGMTLPPNLMFEEKRTRTLDALLVSPATPAHIALGKAICGLFYVLVGAAVTFAVSYTVVVHWGLVLVTTIAAGVFFVSLGLLLGTILESRQQMMLWSWVVLVPLLVPMMFSLMEELLPSVLVTAFRWVPTTLVLNLARTAFAGTIKPADWTGQVLALLAADALAMAAAVWAIRRSDR